MLEWVTINCPYCGEPFEIAVDCSAGSQEYVEDCQVCCNPILVQAEIDWEGRLLALDASRENS